MKRDKWLFKYQKEKILKATQEKIIFHESRLAFWNEQKKKVIIQIKETGINFEETLSDIFSNSYRPTSVQVDNALLSDLHECNAKIKEHQTKISDYKGYEELLSLEELLKSDGSKDNTLNLDFEDWQYFFGS